MKIVTLTLNPAFDLHCFAKGFQAFHENIADVTDFDAGGKGINIARALQVNGIDQTALVVIGEENGASFEAALQKDAVSYLPIRVPGRIRENVTVHTDHADETRISFRGFTAGRDVLEIVETKLNDLCAGDVVTLTGRNPEGMSMDDVKAFVVRLKNKGIRVVIDSRSFTLDDLLYIKPWLIKPNEEEIAMYLKRPIHRFEELYEAADRLVKDGITYVMVSLGSRGACLFSEQGSFTVEAPSIEPVSTIGAGDSSIAGFLAAYSSGKDPEQCLKYAVAYGTAACLTSGTRPPRPEEIGAIFSDLSFIRMEKPLP